MRNRSIICSCIVAWLTRSGASFWILLTSAGAILISQERCLWPGVVASSRRMAGSYGGTSLVLFFGPNGRLGMS
ncbi:hypothetical protein BVC80_1197g8 [Macleaya cordata]|uniref:Uncharacterized protein n=1 Tax=Macleaya cordata TaxID=56857 RepID=A0A200RCL3_MACCD|nr:hypothetical protein BVC80_1197g8 [Macleaya cordata]